MIIPIKCFSCGTVIADKYRLYIQEIDVKMDADPTYFSNDNMVKTIRGETMDKLNIRKICCRRHFLTHVDIV